MTQPNTVLSTEKKHPHGASPVVLRFTSKESLKRIHSAVLAAKKDFEYLKELADDNREIQEIGLLIQELEHLTRGDRVDS